MTGSILSQLTPYRNNTALIMKNQEVGDIMAGILETHKRWAKDYDQIAKNFDKGNKYATARAIFNYLKKNVPYRIEPDSFQTLRSPAAIISMLRGADCKSYALFTAGILDALNRKGKKINWAFRFASYRLLDPSPQHVFVVMDPGTNDEIWIDPVLPEFNEKKMYTYAKDKTPKMALYQISGIGALKKKAAKKSIQKANVKATAAPVSKAAPVKKEKKKILKKVAAKVVDAAKKTGKVALKFAAAPSRNAFLLLVKGNVGGLATKLKAASISQPDKLFKLWKQLQGDPNSLQKAINEGSNKKRILGIGAVTAVATVTAATPILIKVANFLKSIGIDPENLGKLAIEKAKDIAEEKLSEAVAVDKENKQEAAAEIKQAERAFNSNEPISQATIKETESGFTITESGSTGTDFKKYIPYAIGGAALLYFLSKRK